MDEMLTVTQAAEELEIAPGAVRDAAARGSLHAERFGGGTTRAGLLLFRRSEVERYRRENRGRPGRKRQVSSASDEE